MNEPILHHTTWDYHIPNSLLLWSSFSGDYGFLSGKTGCALYFYYMWRSRGNILYKGYADEYLDLMADSLDGQMPLAFVQGVTGIGWAVARLIRDGCLEDDPDEVLGDMDRDIYHEFSTGSLLDTADLLGIIAYACQRLEGRGSEKSRPVYVCKCLEESVDALVGRIEETEHSGTSGFDILWQWPWALYLLDKVRMLGIRAEAAASVLERYGDRVRRMAADPTVCYGRRLMLSLLLKDACGVSSCPVAAAEEAVGEGDDLSVRRGASGLLLLIVLFGKGCYDPMKEDLAQYIRYKIPYENYQYIFGSGVMGGKFSLLDGIAGVGLALELCRIK